MSLRSFALFGGGEASLLSGQSSQGHEAERVESRESNADREAVVSINDQGETGLRATDGSAVEGNPFAALANDKGAPVTTTSADSTDAHVKQRIASGDPFSSFQPIVQVTQSASDPFGSGRGFRHDHDDGFGFAGGEELFAVKAKIENESTP